MLEVYLVAVSYPEEKYCLWEYCYNKPDVRSRVWFKKVRLITSFVLCFAPVSLDCPFLIALFVFSKTFI